MPTRDFTFLLGRDDPATLTAIMAYGASSIPSASRQAILLKGRAIRMVNERLGHIDDALIHAISHLWLVEVCMLFMLDVLVLACCAGLNLLPKLCLFLEPMNLVVISWFPSKFRCVSETALGVLLERST